MKLRGVAGSLCAMALTFLAAGLVLGDSPQRSDLCAQVDMKPVLSLQQINQAELVDYMVVLAGLPRPSAEGKTPEEYYKEEVQMLVDAGYPPILSDVEPDRLVTRRYFASIMYQTAVLTDPDFAAKHGGITNETQQLKALVDSEWLYAEEGKIYREELLSVLCTKPLVVPTAEAVAIEPEVIMESILENPRSPI